MIDCLEQLWACLTCSSVMKAGELIVGEGRPLNCPRCNSTDLQPIGREPITLPEYHGEIGTRN